MLKLNNNTKYFFTLDDPTYVVLKLVNIIGLDIATIVNGFRQPGFYEEKYDGSNCPAGIYYWKLFAELPSPNGLPVHDPSELLVHASAPVGTNGAPPSVNGVPYIVDSDGIFTFPNDCPDKRFKLIDTKEVLII